MTYLGHVDEAQGERLVAQDGPVLVALTALQHDLQLVGVPLQEVRVLHKQQGATQLTAFWKAVTNWRTHTGKRSHSHFRIMTGLKGLMCARESQCDVYLQREGELQVGLRQAGRRQKDLVGAQDPLGTLNTTGG